MFVGSRCGGAVLVFVGSGCRGVVLAGGVRRVGVPGRGAGGDFFVGSRCGGAVLVLVGSRCWGVVLTGVFVGWGYWWAGVMG
jgi:hypothetical protein